MLHRKASYFTPDLALKNELLHVSGRMWMEDAAKYFEEISSLTAKCKASHFKAAFDVDHINSSSIKQVLMYLLLLKDLMQKGTFNSIEVEWSMHEDEHELMEVIRDLEHISEVPIKIKKTKHGKQSL
jgi:hypothetical protein